MDDNPERAVVLQSHLDGLYDKIANQADTLDRLTGERDRQRAVIAQLVEAGQMVARLSREPLDPGKTLAALDKLDGALAAATAAGDGGEGNDQG